MAIHLCVDSPVPTFNSIYQSVIASLTWPPIDITIPSLPCLRNPIFDGFSNINMEIMQLIQELQHFQLMTTLTAGLQPLVALVGGALEDLLPKIAGTNLTLIDILAMDSNAIYAAIRQALLDGVVFPFVPNPIFSGLSMPHIEIVAIVKAVMKGYILDVVQTITDLINAACIILMIPAFAPLPVMPTLENIKAAILAAFPEFSTIQELLASGISVSQIFALLSFAGFPPVILPDPLLPTFSNFEQEFQEAMNIFQSDLLTSLLATIVDFLEDALSVLGIEFPKLCIDF